MSRALQGLAAAFALLMLVRHLPAARRGALVPILNCLVAAAILAAAAASLLGGPAGRPGATP